MARLMWKTTMARDTRTIEELQATAMLLGMWYDRYDHTFNKDGINGWCMTYAVETMEELKNHQTVLRRALLVQQGQLGAKDVRPHKDDEESKEPVHG